MVHGHGYKEVFMDFLTLIAAFLKSKKYTDEKTISKDSGNFSIGMDEGGLYVKTKEGE